MLLRQSGIKAAQLDQLNTDRRTITEADLIAGARAVLDDPNWGHHAAVALGQPEGLPVQYERAGAAHWPGYAAARSAFS